MNSDEAFDYLSKTYQVPRGLLVAQITKIRGENGTTISNLALADWLREQAQSIERGVGAYGRKVSEKSLTEIALWRLCADRLEQETKKGIKDGVVAVA